MAKKLPRLKHFLGNYFLGTEIKRNARNERSIYKEFVTDPKSLKTLLDSSKTTERVNVGLGKYFYSLFDISLLGIFAITKNSAYLIGIPMSEIGRFFSGRVYKNTKEFSDLACRAIKAFCSVENVVDNLVKEIKQDKKEEIDTSGYDGWLNPESYN